MQTLGMRIFPTISTLPPPRWASLGRLLLVAALMGLALGPRAAECQAEAKILRLKERVFDIPINVPEAKAKQIVEYRLFVSTDHGVSWRLDQTAGYGQRSFTFEAPGPGEFWFKLAYEETNGTISPEDVWRAPTELKVIIESADKMNDLTQAVDEVWKNVRGTVTAKPILGDAKPMAGDIRYVNQRAFSIPVQVPVSHRTLVKEVRLFVSRDRGSEWKLFIAVPPGKKSVDFVAPDDGEYWFGIVEVDRLGRLEPANVKDRPPALKVVVDTVGVKTKLEALDSRGGRSAVAFSLDESKVDLTQVKLQVRGSGTDEWEDMTNKGQLDVRWSWPSLPAGSVARVTLVDKAGNVTVEEVTIPAESNAAPAPTATAVKESDAVKK